MIAFLGMGLLGSNFVRAERRRGESVRVWNRSPERARALTADGAEAFEDVAVAVRGASRVHVTLSDDAAVDEVLERARPGFEKSVTIVEHTTTSPRGTAARAARWADRGIAFQHAPVFMGPKNALESTGVMLASGDRARFDALLPALAKMTGKVMYVGEAPERAAGMKLLGNLLLVSMMSGVFDMLGLAKALGIPAADATSIFDIFNISAMLPARTKQVQTADFTQPSWELVMARKDARLMMESAEHGGVALTLIPAIAAKMDAWIKDGHGKDDWTVIATDVVR
jgi:3-hydroxyisobutyrate dehydrogenase